MPRIRLAIIGTRGIGRRHARAAMVAGAEITACMARTRESSESFAAEFGASCCTTNITALKKHGGFDAAVISTPNKFHAPYAVAMMESGADVLLEKPMAMNSRESAVLVRAAKKLRRVMLVGHMWRFDREVSWAREVVASGLIGAPVRTVSYGSHVNWGPSGWFLKKSLAGGGALADMGIHALDTAGFILGDPAPRSVYARIGTSYGDYDVDDTGVVMVEWKGGAFSVIECGWFQPHSDRPYAGTQVYGTKGYTAIFPPEVKVSLAGKPGKFLPDAPRGGPPDKQHMYDAQMLHFLDCVRTRNTPSPGPAEGHLNMRMVDAAYRSARTGQAIALS